MGEWDVTSPDDVIRQAMTEIAARRGDMWSHADSVIDAALNLADHSTRGADLYLVWTNFYDQTLEPGGEAAAEAAMPTAAEEWLAATGNDAAKQAYLDRWFDYHGLGSTP